MAYRPSGPFNVPMTLFVPTETMAKGVTKKTYPAEGSKFFGRFRTFGGSERVVNDVIVLDDTGTVETWYRSDITADCRIEIGGKPYEILGTPENIEMRNQFLVFRVRAYRGGA